MKTIASEIDESVNFVIPYGEGMIEVRYVRRQPDYFICYLSSQTGCVKACRFCHLTTTKQTSFEQVNESGFLEQAEQVLRHYMSKAPAKVINFNWMSRGEALDNPTVRHYWRDLAGSLQDLVQSYDMDLVCRFNVSTIIPKTVGRYGDFTSNFNFGPYPTIYYSLYSMDQEWRDKWLPGAMPAEQALDELKRYQDITQKIVYIHGAFIKEENDSLLDIAKMCQVIKDRGLVVKWNMVKYNPFSTEEGEESPNYRGIYNLLDRYFPGMVQVVSRLDKSTFAPCGMFYSGELYE